MSFFTFESRYRLINRPAALPNNVIAIYLIYLSLFFLLLLLSLMLVYNSEVKSLEEKKYHF